MEKIAKSRSKNKLKGNIPQIYLKAGKKEFVEIKPNKIPKKKLKFNESNRRFGNDITNSIKNNVQYGNGYHSLHQKSSSVVSKANKVGTKINQVQDNNSSLKKVNSIGRNVINKNVEKTFSGENLYHKKKINDSIENNKNNDTTQNPKLKSSITNVGNITQNENEKVPSPKNKEKLIRISEFRIEPVLDNNKNENNKYVVNNSKDIINRLKNQSCSLKSSITNKNQNNDNKNKAINHIFDSREIFAINKHLTKEQLLKGMNILSKHDTFEIGQKKFMYGDKNKFNKNTHVFKEKLNNSNNLCKNKSKKQSDIIYKIKNLKTFHPNKCSNNNKSIKQTQENIDNKNNDENKENIINEAIPKDNTKINDEKITIEIKEEKEEIKKENIKIIENIEIEENKKDKKVEKEEENKAKHDKKDKNNTSEKNQQEQKELKDQKVQKEKEINNERNNNNLHIENTNDIAPTTNDTIELNTSQEKVIYFDINHITDVQIPKDYLNVIYYNLLDEENKDLPAKPVHTYMKKQKEINDQMRSILVDWIIDVHHKFGFTDETLFMTILIIDRYCSIEQISRIKYQCLGITALMIACKHEEINVPKVEDFIYITDNAYTKEEVFKMENDVLSKLNFELLFPSPIKFYEYLSLHFNFCKKYHMLGKYLMETFLLDLKYIKYKPSIISCACTYIVMKFFKMENYRHSYEKKFFLLDENVNTIPNGYGVKDCAQDICIYVDNINNTNLLSCQKKYSKTEFEKVATLISNNKT